MNYSDANNYRFRRFDIEAEDIPTEAAFKTYLSKHIVMKGISLRKEKKMSVITRW